MAQNDSTDLRPVEVMWSPAKVAAYMGLNVETVYRMLKRGDIQNAVRLGGAIRIPQSEVQRLVNEKRIDIAEGAGE